MLIYLLGIVILLRLLRKEGLTTYLKYKEISHLFEHNISGESDCIYTQVPPQIAKVYNIDFDSPFDRYTKLNINSKYNLSYYDDTSFNVDLDISKNVANNVLPFFHTYKYCDLKDGKSTCHYSTCGTPEEISTNKIESHNKGVANLIRQRRFESVNKTPSQRTMSIVGLNSYRSYLSNQYNKYNTNSNNYINNL